MGRRANPWFSSASLRLATLVLQTGVASACSRTPRLPPRAGPEEVRLIDPDLGQFPEPGYRTLGPLTIRRPPGTSTADLVLALRAEAARMGAHAVILQRIGTAEEDLLTFRVADGLAIYWIDRGRGVPDLPEP